MDPNSGGPPPPPERPKSPRTARRNDTMVVPSPRIAEPRAEGGDERERDGEPRDDDEPEGRVEELLEEVRKPPLARISISEHVAAGGMGTIDVATDRALERRIAIKTLHPHLRCSDMAVRMFLREARLTSLLDHPHIVPIYDIGERESGDLFFTMKLVEGRTLADVIRALPAGLLDTSALYGILDIVTKVCDALAFAHSRGILHCDIKPSNVMVGEFGQVYLMDWGIARRIGPHEAGGAPRSKRELGGTDTSMSAIVGTPGYMSPEQARGEQAALDERTDVFLIGALIYEALTRKAPYANADRSSTLRLAARGEFPPPRTVAGEGSVAPELERIVLRAMAFAPEDRYPSVAALRDDVVRFMRGGAEFPRRAFEAGEIIVQEGDPGDAAYIIVAGRCEITRAAGAGRTVVRTIGPGDVFGEMAIMTEGPRTATVRALDATTVLVVTSEALEQEMAALKPWMATLLKSLATRFREIDSKDREGRPAETGSVRPKGA